MKTVQIISGTEADVKTINGLGLKIVEADLKPAAVKIGRLDSAADMTSTKDFLTHYAGPVVLDTSLYLSVMDGLFRYVTLVVLNLQEAEIILNRSISTHEAIEEAAAELLRFGVKSVLIKGELLHELLWVHDYWTDGVNSFWLTQKCYSDAKYPESGAVFSAAITASLALGYRTEDALIIAKMYVHQAIRLAQTTLYYGSFPENEVDLPYLSSVPLYAAPSPFKCAPYLGLYPVVDSSDWVDTLLQLGVKTIQLRIKEKTKILEEEIKRSIALAKKHQATLFINDYWELALKLDAQAIHLGQSDLNGADLEAIQEKGLLLGVSTHCYYEVARAHAICPSYVAIGPIYPTTSKDMGFSAQGMEQLQRWKRTLKYPLVAIGGINLDRTASIVDTGVCGIALISAITEAADPKKATQQLLNLIP